MPIAKVKNYVSSPKSRPNGSKFTLKAGDFNEDQLTELLTAYQTLGKLLEKLVGRERIYRPQFLTGLESALKDVASGRTKEVKSFEDFVG